MITDTLLTKLVDEATVYNTSNSITDAYFDRSKFAQLIVEECAKVAENKNQHYVSGYFERAVKRHFGIE